MTAAPIHIAGERLMLDPAGCLHWPAQRLLAVADLHFEKSTASAARGALLPPYDTRETLELLAGFVRKYAPRTIVALGDSFHDARGSHRLQPKDALKLQAIAGAEQFIWVLGNHDPQPPEGLPGAAVAEHRQGSLVFRHEAQEGRVMGEISGHFHPKASIAVRGAQVQPRVLHDFLAHGTTPSGSWRARPALAGSPSSARVMAVAAATASSQRRCS